MGASRGIGMATAKAALDRGHKVRAFSRSTSTIDHPMFSGMTGNALSPADVERALEGIDAVVQALGVGLGDLFRPVTLFSQASAILIDAMQRLGPQRLSAVTGFGAGDSQAAISPLQRLPFRLLFGRAYDDKSLQEGIAWRVRQTTLSENKCGLSALQLRAIRQWHARVQKPPDQMRQQKERLLGIRRNIFVNMIPSSF
jgi:uncharacterized protein YbjT (DUF2867 family)